MKIKKYGYSEFNQKSELKFAVVVPIADTKDDGTSETTWQFVTRIEHYPHRRWYADNHEKAYLFNERKDAQDFVIGLAQAWTAGFVVEVLEGYHPTNNWK